MNYNFVFDGNKTNEVLAHNRLFYIEKVDFGNGHRVNITDNKGFSNVENTSNQSFRKNVDISKSLNEQIYQWANYILNQYTMCDICGNLEMVLPLRKYDYETFPQLEGKKVCDKCRTKFYIEHIKGLESEINAEQENQKQGMKKKGHKHLYTFWIHPNHGDDFAVDIFTSNKLTKELITKERKNLIKEYSASKVENPIYSAL